ncbi:MAG TPA: nicotinamide riboside transporter PnuC [Bacteroidales bacterium]|nr:nicotinamide riboside transporter PnuC [Bacteroidales bacterium]
MDIAIDWILNNYIEIFGAAAGIIYVFLEIRQNIWLWPVGIVTSAVYIYVFFTGKLYADMSLQGYYLVISVAGWYWWLKGSGLRARSAGQGNGGTKGLRDEGTERRRDEETKRRREGGTEGLKVTRLTLITGIVLAIVFAVLYALMWFVLDRFTDSPVPLWDSFITSLSIIATWMLARKIYEHWFLWIIVNAAAALLFFTRELYPTVILYSIYLIMSFAGLKEWGKSLKEFAK